MLAAASNPRGISPPSWAIAKSSQGIASRSSQRAAPSWELAFPSRGITSPTAGGWSAEPGDHFAELGDHSTVQICGENGRAGGHRGPVKVAPAMVRPSRERRAPFTAGRSWSWQHGKDGFGDGFETADRRRDPDLGKASGNLNRKASHNRSAPSSLSKAATARTRQLGVARIPVEAGDFLLQDGFAGVPDRDERIQR